MQKKTPKVYDVLAAIETFAPKALAEEWDNPGLQVGDLKQQVKIIWTALDPQPEIITKAAMARADLLLTHHPLFFSPIKALNLSQPVPRGVATAIKSNLAVVCAHTNLDSAKAGINYIMAKKLGLKEVRPLVPALVDPTTGLGRVGQLAKKTTLGELALSINKMFGKGTLRVVGNLKMPVTRVAVCSGSGKSVIGDFERSGAEVFITGDIGYHTALDAETLGYGLIDLGHFRSENIVVEPLAKMIKNALDKMGFDVAVKAYKSQKEPFKYIGE